jgi:hypothetical protein
MVKSDFNDLLLMIVEKANYSYENIHRLVKINIEECERRIREIEAMSEEAFLSMVSKSLFGVASKGYYIGNFKRKIETLKMIPQRIDYLLDLWKNDKGWLEWVIKKSYKGYVKQMREAIERLAQDRFTAKLLSFSS